MKIHFVCRSRQLLLPFLCAACLGGLNAARAQDKPEQVSVNEVERTFTVHLPKNYDSQQHYPVVLMLPGRQQEAEDIAALSRLNEVADRNGFIAVYPNALHGRWNVGVQPEQPQSHEGRAGRGGGGFPPMGGGPMGRRSRWPGGTGGGDGQTNRRNRPSPPADDIAFFNQMLDKLGATYAVDSSRIYATGLSDGGFMDFDLGCRMAGRIAAIAPVGAAMPKTLSCIPTRLLPVLMINGTSDPVVPYKGGTGHTTFYTTLSAEESAKTWARFNNCDANKSKRTNLPPQAKGGEKVQVDKFECTPEAEVLLYSIKGGGNTWPGGAQFLPEKEVGKTSKDLDASEVIWKFFAAHKLPVQTPPQS